MCFRPMMTYVHFVLGEPVTFLSSHRNRRFMYDWIDDKNFLPTYGMLSRDESKQHGYIHEYVSARDYNIFVKSFKDFASIKTNALKRDIDHHTVQYLKTTPRYSIYNKIFDPIEIPKVDMNTKFMREFKKGDYTVFVPDNSISVKESKHIYKELKKLYNVIVIGDMKCHLPDENILLKRVDYFENGYKYIFNLLNNAQLVVTPCSHWTFLCNLQGWPVISWGESPSIYKEDGIFGFGNKNSIIPHNKGDSNKRIVDHVKYVMDEISRRF
jgi:hypothetical protein